MTKEDALPKPASMLERELSQETLEAIKAIVREDREAAPAEEKQLNIPGRQRRIKAKRKNAATQKSTVRRRVPQLAEAQQAAPGMARRATATLKRSIPGGKVLLGLATPRRIAIAVILTTFLIEPWFIPTALILMLLIMSFIALALGPDRMRHYFGLGWKRFAARRPKKAARLQKQAMHRLERFQKRLDKLPFRMGQGIHLPQMQTEAEQSAAETAYSRRMAQMAREERQQSYS